MPNKEEPGVADLEEIVVENKDHDTSYLENNFVRSFTWKSVNVVVPDRETKKDKQILTNASGYVEAGNSSLPS